MISYHKNNKYTFYLSDLIYYNLKEILVVGERKLTN